MKCKFGFVLLFLVFLASNCFALDIPFTIEKGYLIVPAKVRKDISVEMVVNTGLDVSLIDAGGAEKYKFGLPSYTSVGQVTGRNDKTVVFHPVSDVSLGDEKPISFWMKHSALVTIKQRIGRDIFGVLGADFFKGRSLKLDFKNKTLSFVKQANTKDTPNAKVAGLPIIYKMSQMRRNIFGQEIIVPVCEDVLINGKKIKTLFDTGSPFPLSILPSGTKELDLEPAEKEKTKPLQIKSLKLSEFEVKDFSALLFGKDSFPEQYETGFGAVIGLGVMQNFVVTFDFKKSLITLE